MRGTFMDIDAIDLEPSDTEELTPNEFLRLYELDKDDIASVRIIPPLPGTTGFGRLLVKHKTPLYAHHRMRAAGATLKVFKKRRKIKRLLKMQAKSKVA